MGTKINGTMSTENVSVITSNDTSTEVSTASSYSSSLNSTSSDHVTSINMLVAKLGHDLAEIRSRALDNLMSKLDNHVITEIDLVQHKQLFIKLFELFNFPQFKQHEVVLNLLFNLSKVGNFLNVFRSKTIFLKRFFWINVKFLVKIYDDKSCLFI